jgi:hypothetical protein
LLPFYFLAKGSSFLVIAYLTSIGAALMYKSTVMVHRMRQSPFFLWVFVALPSVLFWTSGIQKEALLYPLWVLAGVHCWVFFNSTTKNKWSYVSFIFILLVTTSITYLLKFYYLIPLTALLGIWCLEWSIKNQTHYRMVLLLLMVALLVATSIHPYISIFNFNEIISANYFNFCNHQPATCIHLPIDGTTTGVLQALPQALLKGLLGPYFWEWKNPMYVLQGLEHLILVTGLGTAVLVYGLKKNNIKSFYLTLIWCLTMASLHVLTAPNYGSLSRYEAIYFPLLLFVLAEQINFATLFNKHKWTSFLMD